MVPCIVCRKQQKHYDHFCVLESEEQMFLRRSTLVVIFQMIVASAVLIPRRPSGGTPPIQNTFLNVRKEIRILLYTCTVLNQSVLLLWLASEKIIIPSDETQVLFRQQLKSVVEAVVLCVTHYQRLYRQTHSPWTCSSRVPGMV